MTLPLPTSVDDPNTQQVLDHIAQQFPIQGANLARGSILVTELPEHAVAGTEAFFFADKANGVIWHLVYDGEGTYPWKKIGGPPLSSQYTAAEHLTTTSSTPQTTNAPSVTAPLAMEFEAVFGANLSVNGGASQARMRLFIGGVEQTDKASWTSAGGADAVNTVIAPLHARDLKTATKSQAIQARYYSSAAGKNAEFYAPYIEIDPIRVG